MSTGHSAKSHKKTRKDQGLNAIDYHHPEEKIRQLDKFKGYFHLGDILEVFGGKGNLTEYYRQFGNVTALTQENFGNSFDAIYILRGEKKKYDVIDIDSYEYPNRFFPVVFEMMKPQCLLVFTFPILGVNCFNGITEQHFYNFYRCKPSIGDVVGRITDWALRNGS